MPTRALILLGGGGHCKSVIDIDSRHIARHDDEKEGENLSSFLMSSGSQSELARSTYSFEYPPDIARCSSTASRICPVCLS